MRRIYKIIRAWFNKNLRVDNGVHAIFIRYFGKTKQVAKHPQVLLLPWYRFILMRVLW